MTVLADSRTASQPRVSSPRRVVILGSTGSIGTNTLDVISSLEGRFEVLGLSAHSNLETLKEQVAQHRPRWVVLTHESSAGCNGTRWATTQILCGESGLEHIVTHPDVDVVVVAIVGAAGLRGTWAALEAGKTVAVANKETLVMAGPQVLALAKRTGATLLPVDSEHSAVFQLLRHEHAKDIERVVLTASGGPFRGRTLTELEQVTVAEALCHPTWRMGPKITVDSATLMNKALEVIEARWLFGLQPDQIKVVIHPESIVHAMVEFKDGAVLAQLSPPDMRLPIQYALTYPERIQGPARRLDWEALSALHFEKPDLEAFPALQLGYEVAERGGTCGAVLNAANEAAVSRFLNGTLRFTAIPKVCRQVLEQHHYRAQPTLEELMALDRWARLEVARCETG